MYINDVIESYLSHSTSSPKTVDDFPYFTNGPDWETISSSGWDNWVAGFWPGLLWMGSAIDDEYRQAAVTRTQAISSRLTDNFNIGFRNQYSWLSGYEVTGNKLFRSQTRDAVDRLLDCFHPGTKLIVHRRDDEIHVSATDAMMNLPLLLWSYQHGYKPVRCRWVVEQTLSSAMDHFVREDGGIHHLLQFNAKTGQLLAIESPQGYPAGCWSRGLAWMAAGLVLGGIVFHREDALVQAQDLMLYHWNHSDDVIPPYDYGAENNDNNIPPDTSAGAILASAMLLLGKENGDSRIRRGGRAIVNTLFDDYRRAENEDGLIGGSSFHVPDNSGVNEATIWGDFYALESLYLMEKNNLPPHLNWLNAA